MKTDLFQESKGIHLKLGKITHADLRARLFKEGLSMQEVFEEFARLIVAGDHMSNKILENLSARKIKDIIGYKAKRSKDFNDVTENEKASLYNIIEGD